MIYSDYTYVQVKSRNLFSFQLLWTGEYHYDLV